MSAANDLAIALELLRHSIDELTRKIRDIDPNDPMQDEYENELYALRVFKVALQSEHNKLIQLRMARLAREVASLEPCTQRRSEIVRSILRFAKRSN